MNKETTVDWRKVKAVIFDVDGTLYDQSKLRKKMLLALLNFYLWRPWRINEIMMLAHFRSERERRAGRYCQDLENAQYTWCSEKKGYPVSKIREVVEQWIFKHPVKYLEQCMYLGTREFFNTLRQHDIKIAIYSDYKAYDKLKAMNLGADLVVSSTDPEVDRLKPDPKGLIYASARLGVAIEDCLFIGDRHEMDGACALSAGMPYLIVDKKPFEEFDFYTTLTSHLTQTIKQQTYGKQHNAS
ncbi:HAD family hydrolase [Pontibacter silvestris]|uniref:phosphoglycolate phosphatase n=1 Tax=Pontibacter silvestris TaxID=2305183 RepID=A0ABW4WU31_9BACT|nr:HAD family hydrolase [Pontibacter silvestris]MCC9137792.1 HAD family hydrolase [Pontibacter silvestris]